MDIKFLFLKLFWKKLTLIDQENAVKTKNNGCPKCGSPLHVANYDRLPRGGPNFLIDQKILRFSLCCSKAGCRRRVMPPSVRFLGRNIYWGAIFLIASIMTKKLNSLQSKATENIFAISRQTLQRWGHFWKNKFPKSRFWKRSKGLFSEMISVFPKGLFDFYHKFNKSTESTVIALLKFLSDLKLSDFSS